MRKCILVMAILLMAVPAIAGIEITPSNTGYDVTISYDRNSMAEKIRAFALDITVDNGATISSPGSWNSKYPIYPGSIVITGGEVTGSGSAVCDPCDYTGTLGADANGMTIEMASLYADDDTVNVPADSGVLFTFTVSGDCNVTIDENSARGGVVMEDPEVANGETFPIVYKVTAATPTCWDVTECVIQSTGDATCDGNVNLADLSALKLGWGKSKGDTGWNCCADFTHDETVNLADLSALKLGWGQTGQTPSTGNQDCPQ